MTRSSDWASLNHHILVHSKNVGADKYIFNKNNITVNTTDVASASLYRTSCSARCVAKRYNYRVNNVCERELQVNYIGKYIQLFCVTLHH